MSFDRYWRNQLNNVLLNGQSVSPRGKLTAELLHQSFAMDMRRPVLRNPTRKLDYRFMAAEAYWILSGNDSVEGIAPFNARIAEFSDNGETFFGAYGPKIMAQLPYVLAKLTEDDLSRQAVLTIWRETPPPTKDVPCTVAIGFTLRKRRLNCHVFMRSSDLWLGLPYDVFNFSMLGHLVCANLNATATNDLAPVEPDMLYLTAVSSHLYQNNWVDAGNCYRQPVVVDQAPTPDELHRNPMFLMQTLADLRFTRPGDMLRWWEKDDATN